MRGMEIASLQSEELAAMSRCSPFRQLLVWSGQEHTGISKSRRLTWQGAEDPQVVLNSIKLRIAAEPALDLYSFNSFLVLMLGNHMFSEVIKIQAVFLTLLVLVSWLNCSTRKYNLAYLHAPVGTRRWSSLHFYLNTSHSVPDNGRCVLLSNPEGSIFQHECSDPYTVIITPYNAIPKVPCGPSLLDERHYKNERYVHNGSQ